MPYIQKERISSKLPKTQPALRKKFSKWYSRQILHALENRCEVVDVKVDAKGTLMQIWKSTGIFVFT